ncbi:YagK/YfjJ domain-containing protein [Vibrio sp. M60_M70]|uniref:YagK/YfjJ domain-containing protein n=1 Tax=Vibrio sp. M60_M70 TaxID=3035166 RepID=UPI00301C947E
MKKEKRIRVREPKIYQGEFFYDIKLNPKREYYEPYLIKSKELLDYVTTEHNRIIAFSVVLRFPQDLEQDRDISYITKFRRLFQRKINFTLEEKKRKKLEFIMLRKEIRLLIYGAEKGIAAIMITIICLF